MKLLLCLMLVGAGLCSAMPAHAEPFRPGQSFDQEQMARITAAALAFMAPRILQKVPVEQLAVWGLRGLTTLDSRLSPTLDDAMLRLLAMMPEGPRLLLERPAPGDEDADGWGQAVGQIARVAWNVAEPVRRVGTEGVVRTFFDELFNHLDPYSRYVSAFGRSGATAGREADELAATVLEGHVDDILVLHILAFQESTAGDLAQAMQRDLKRPRRARIRGLILDLRNDRGGVLAQAAAAAGMVLTHGLLATTEGRDPAATHVFRADGPDASGGLPIIVLIDGRTASAAEIFAAALADQGRAVVVGSVSLGKGLVQTILNLPDGGLLYVTWSRVLAPRGWPIQSLGVLPQVCTSLGDVATRRELAALAAGAQPFDPALEQERAVRPPATAEEALEIRANCPAAVGRDADVLVARYLLHHPAAYRAALLPPPP